MSLTNAQYYGRAIPVVALTGALCVLFATWGAMAGGWSSQHRDYQSTLLTLYGYVMAFYYPAFVLLLIRPALGVAVFWSLIACGALLFGLSGLRDGAMVVSIYSIVIPTLGSYLQKLRSRRNGEDGTS